MQTISSTIQDLHLGQAETFEGLTLIPLFGSTLREPDYLTLDQALEQKLARVLEVSEGGSVPNLLFENLGDRKVLLVDGDELVGAKQNRIINLTILVAAHSKIEIPVSCVEAGRWRYDSEEFDSRKRSMFSRARAAKTDNVTARMRTSGERYSEQTEVWDNIAACSMCLDVDSETGSMGDLYDQQEERIKGYREAFQAQDGQVGAVFAVNGAVQGVEYFDSPAPFRQYLDRLVGSYAVEAMLEPDASAPVMADESVKAFLEQVTQAGSESYAALGLGEDLRLSGEALAGGALLAEERIVHLAVFRLDPSEAEEDENDLHFRNRPVH